MITTTNPRTGATEATDLAVTSDAEVAAISHRAATAAKELAAIGRLRRADLLDAIAAALEADREVLIPTAMAETGLTDVRLNGELTRTVFQFQLFSEAVREGSFLEVAIDHAGTTPLGPGPDVRRLLVPLGAVAVFGSSNFPFAFSVPGGDTASALAAGNAVVAKAHSAHPLTCAAVFATMERACREFGAPDGTIGIVYGQKAGAALVAEPAISAVGFTGSLDTGKRLQAIIDMRDEPIPFYGELSSMNPLVITSAALLARSDEIATGLATSVIASSGQLCTKPGFAFIPTGELGDAFLTDLAAKFVEADAAVLLNERVHDSYAGARLRMSTESGVSVVAEGQAPGAEGFFVSPTILSVAASDLTPGHAEEAFGPLIMAVRYEGNSDLFAALENIPSSLTASIHYQTDDADFVRELVNVVKPRAGRLVFNGFPTGVRVSWAQHHGGPWPSTNTIHTSVGITAMRRFLRPLAWQDAPDFILPEELRDADSSVARRLDGILTLPK
ncbi:MAG: aldehyde dehydrogenase family protein [Actinobacteria bacterium]|uniref:Unannotated protein n=1 Tax=freshwater metagenome TaxID=449393 RepID=A0A6J7F223_9ZZZZ|nr:aldehyde dehydrogenase family protein [Actinomycetota bacterium]